MRYDAGCAAHERSEGDSMGDGRRVVNVGGDACACAKSSGKLQVVDTVDKTRRDVKSRCDGWMLS
jgi:hypothetical protein